MVRAVSLPPQITQGWALGFSPVTSTSEVGKDAAAPGRRAIVFNNFFHQRRRLNRFI